MKDTDLEAEDATFCHQEFSEVLIEECLSAKLWDKWGLVVDVIVNAYYFYSLQY